MPLEQISIGKDKAIALYRSGWWKEKTHRDIAEFQMATQELCVPFEIFHEALEKTLGRPVFTHELGSDGSVGIMKELRGEKPPATLDEIINLIPEEKRILIVA